MGRSLPARILRWLLIAAAVLLALFVLLVIDPSGALVMRAIALAGLALFCLSVLMMLVTFRRARRLSPFGLAIAALTSVAGTGAFLWLAGTPVATGTAALAVAAGGMIGAGWAVTNLLFVDGDAVRARGNLWFLAIWGVSLALPQLAALAGGRAPSGMAVVALLGMGLAVGNSLGLIARYRAARRRVVTGDAS